MTAQIQRAADMAGKWWADRLDEQHADKREAFAAAVSRRVVEGLTGQAVWNWNEGRSPSDGKPPLRIFIECDYDPQGLLLDAVREVVDPDCRGFGGSADGILPLKHELMVSPTELHPKEGYGNFTDWITVPLVEAGNQ